MSNIPSQPSPVELAYARPIATGSSRVWAGFAVAFVGLVIMFFGGCFTIGLLLQLHPGIGFGGITTSTPWSSGDYLLHGVLYVLAFGCFIGGGFLVVRGAAGLLRLLGNAQS